MDPRRWLAMAGGATALLGMVALGNPAVWAQEATPEAGGGAAPARPVHIHSGNCEELGDVVQPLNDLAEAGGDRVGQARRAVMTQFSATNVPLTLDAIVGADHAINAHLSAEEIGTYIACGEIGGVPDAQGALTIGLRESQDSGFTGIAFLAPGADGASTDISVFIGETQRTRDRAQQADATPAAGGQQTEASDADADMAATPMADMGGDAMMSGDQVQVSLTEFVVSMPTSLPAGEVTFAITNDGTFTHSFEIENEAMEEELAMSLEPGESATLTVTLEPGTYEVYCPVGNHRDQGMEIEVSAA